MGGMIQGADGFSLMKGIAGEVAHRKAKKPIDPSSSAAAPNLCNFPQGNRNEPPRATAGETRPDGRFRVAEAGHRPMATSGNRRRADGGLRYRARVCASVAVSTRIRGGRFS